MANSAENNNAETGSAAPSSKVPPAVEASLPADVVNRLRTAVQSAGRVSDRLVSELDARFDIQNAYGVNINRLRHYLRRIPKKTNPATPRSTARTCTGAAVDQVDPQRLAAYRSRQASVASILEGLFGRLADSDPSIWDRRAYQLLVGLVYERLACDTDELPTSELMALAKVLNESRKADSRAVSKPKPDGDDLPNPATRKLPERFGEMIRQVYGTSIGDAPADEQSSTSTPAQKAASG